MKVEFHWIHYTRTFRRKAVIAEEGYLSIEFRNDDLVGNVLQNIFLRVLHRVDATDVRNIPPFDDYGFIHQNARIDADLHIWKRELGSEGTGDFTRITATFPPTIQKRFKQEWDDLYCHRKFRPLSNITKVWTIL